MPLESEVKIKVNSFGRIRERLSGIKAKKVSVVHEKNIVYDTTSGELMKEDMLLRLRYEKGEDEAERRIIITLKGPDVGGVAKERQEFEVKVSDFRKAHEVLCALGFRKALIYEKRREKWIAGKTVICLDKLPFGLYVEIEGSVENIGLLARKLGFDRRSFINLNYLELAGMEGFSGDILFRQ